MRARRAGLVGGREAGQATYKTRATRNWRSLTYICCSNLEEMEHELEMEFVGAVSIPSYPPHPPEGWEEMGGDERGGGWDGQDGVVPDADPLVPGVDLVVPDVHPVVPDANKDPPGPPPRRSIFLFNPLAAR